MGFLDNILSHILGSSGKDSSPQGFNGNCSLEDYRNFSNERTLPKGAGYKSIWIVIEGSNQKDIVKELQLSNLKSTDYNNSINLIQTSGNDKLVMVAPDYQNRNYIFGEELSNIFYNTESFVNKFKNFNRVYAYMTHRVGGCHAFALVENGRLVRFFNSDDDGLQSTGKQLPVETALNFNLPRTLDEMFDHIDDGTYTDVDEETIVTLATAQTGVDEQYPYSNCIIGTINI